MRLSDKGAILTEYWRLFGDRSLYKVLLSSTVTAPLVVTKTGAKIAGALVRIRESPGALVLLPYLDLEADDFYQEAPDQADDELDTSGEDDEEMADGDSDDEGAGFDWSPDGIKFGNQLRACLFAIDENLRQGAAASPTPTWSQDPSFLLPREATLRERLLSIETQLEVVAREKEDLKRQLDEEGVLRRLLFEKGPRLEDAIARALRIVGFTAAPYRDAKSEFDVVFEALEGRLIGEAEGKDNKPINVDKLRQLEMNLHEDFARDEVSQMAHGVLFGNAHRLLPPAQRGEYFTIKVMTAAERSGCALVRTPELFAVVQYLSASSDVEFARRCRESIVAAKGAVVVFPAVPTLSAPPSTDVVEGAVVGDEEADKDPRR